VYGYGRGGEYVYMLRYTYAGIREINLQMEEEHRHKSRVMRTSIGTITQVSINLADKESRNKKVVVNTEPNTKHAGRATHIERQVEKKAYTHFTDS